MVKVLSQKKSRLWCVYRTQESECAVCCITPAAVFLRSELSSVELVRVKGLLFLPVGDTKVGVLVCGISRMTSLLTHQVEVTQDSRATIPIHCVCGQLCSTSFSLNHTVCRKFSACLRPAHRLHLQKAPLSRARALSLDTLSSLAAH